MQCYSAIFQFTENTYFNVISTLCMQYYSAILQYTRTRILALILMLQCSAIVQYCNTLKTGILTLFLHFACSSIAQYLSHQPNYSSKKASAWDTRSLIKKNRHGFLTWQIKDKYFLKELRSPGYKNWKKQQRHQSLTQYYLLRRIHRGRLTQ